MVSKVLTNRPAFDDTFMRRAGHRHRIAPRSKTGHLAAGPRPKPAASRSGRDGHWWGREEPTKMPEVLVGKIADIADGDRRIVTHGELEIGVFHWQGHFYAYENLCLHQGGPCCEGVIMHKVEDLLGPDKTWRGQRFSADEAHFVCPWHGYEYDIKTGECAGNRRLRLRAFEVVRRGPDLYVLT
jgi:nitrite reductase/ring-hydroxylating ferredoxin subunit